MFARFEAQKLARIELLSQFVKATLVEREGIHTTDPTETWWHLEAVKVKGRDNHLGYAKVELDHGQALEVAFSRLKQDQKIMLDALTNPIPMNDYSFLTR